MWGVDKKDLAPIHAVAQRLYSDYNPEKLGAWGILFLCCGALERKTVLGESGYRIAKFWFALQI